MTKLPSSSPVFPRRVHLMKLPPRDRRSTAGRPHLPLRIPPLMFPSTTSTRVVPLPGLSLGLPLGLSFRNQLSAGRARRTRTGVFFPLSRRRAIPPPDHRQSNLNLLCSTVQFLKSRYPTPLRSLPQLVVLDSRRNKTRQSPRVRLNLLSRPPSPTLRIILNNLLSNHPPCRDRIATLEVLSLVGLVALLVAS